eukprot:CAMPEP_0206230578 /NCGR_PEP_ID=MMETSP0047_2-20121206/10341_1 /ASSEMBLY_ACC=CAM_ASM_000192 /TAXON_ID=195065 /ORGANISM="Chroomonas mesostigmatica_cf, Strain CCMP1168" /LENGTH=243 /DNA_ID=CAMNT_0053654025 /DNA_START=49 /DNA_END=780 /DNA_ORIENTATION=-
MTSSWLPSLIFAALLVGEASSFMGDAHVARVILERARVSRRSSYSPVASMSGAASSISAAEAKTELLSLLSGTTELGKRESEERAAQIDRLVDVLAATGRNQYSPEIDGDWALVMSRNAKGSPSLQKASNAVERLGGTFQNFDVSKGSFDNFADVLGGKGRLYAGVEYKVVPEMDGTRISADIVDAHLKIWKVKIPLPLRVKGGWLDFLFVDEDLRITKGNRGGLFVHVRPSKLREVWGIETN